VCALHAGVATVAHVFISYSKKHRPLTERIAALLERQEIGGADGSREPLTVWWDKSLLSGDVFHREITREIDAARAVVVVWSEGAVASDWVYAEAQRGASQRKLVPLREASLDRRKIPLPYSALHIDDANNDAAIVASVMARLGGRPGEDVRGLGAEQTWLLDPKAEPPLERTARISPALLLQAKHRVVPFVDIDGRLPDLIDWALGRGKYQPQKTAGRVIHGPGGLGKTRLLIEVVSELADEGWLAGFVNRGVLGHHTRGPQLESLVRDGRDARGLLLVVDYAEGRSEEVKALSRLMIERERAGGAPARLVLLSRAAGDWWRDLSGRDANVALVFGTGEETMDTARLADIASGDTRTKIWKESADALKSYLVAAGHSEVRDLDPAAPPAPLAARLQALRHDADYARPLAIQMEALLWLRGASPEVAERGIPPMLDRMVYLEREHWAKVTEGVSEIGLDRGVAQVTAVQGVEGREQAIALLKEDSTYFGARTMETAATIVRELAKLYGEHVASDDDAGGSRTDGERMRLGALEPDLVGEHHVVSLNGVEPLVDACLVWAGDDARKRRSILTVLNRATRPEHGAMAERASELLDRLVRDRLQSLAADMVAVMVETPGGLAQRLDRQVGTFDDKTLAVIDTSLPRQSLSLMDLSLRVAQRRVDIARESVGAADQKDAGLTTGNPGTTAVSNRLGDRLVTLGARLSNFGHHAEALVASQEAVDVYRRLEEARPDAFLSDLAMSLNNVASTLSNLGRHEQALAASREALDIFRRLAKTQGDAFLPNLATSLNSLGNRLAALGAGEGALVASRDAVDIYRRLAEKRPDAFLPDLAMCLTNLGNRISEVGRCEEALCVSQEAVDIYRSLADKRPDAFLPDLAKSLHNLGIRFSDLGRREDAITTSQEAVDVYRLLAEARPDAFLPNLATSLHALGIVLAALERHGDAASVTHEGLTKIAPFVERHAQAYGDLAFRLSQDYLDACGKIGAQRDAALLERIARALGLL
jgi:tetratricopeptide (TPR) repeat protein